LPKFKLIFYILTNPIRNGGFMKSFACKDIGMRCDFVVTAKTEEELFEKIAEHAKKAHNIRKIDDATKEKIKAAIKEA